nr:reverse transcriptase domain-containing protein [Tanacetum cinerariifolium]
MEETEEMEMEIMKEIRMEETEDMEMEGMKEMGIMNELWRFHANGSRVHFSRLFEVDLTWWNFHKRKIGVDAAYAMKWARLMKLMTQLMDKKHQGYAAKSAENKRRMESNPRDNHGQQPSFKKQNTTGHNVARAYTAGNNERKGFVGSFPYYNKCRLDHEGLCTISCGN